MLESKEKKKQEIRVEIECCELGGRKHLGQFENCHPHASVGVASLVND